MVVDSVPPLSCGRHLTCQPNDVDQNRTAQRTMHGQIDELNNGHVSHSLDGDAGQCQCCSDGWIEGGGWVAYAAQLECLLSRPPFAAQVTEIREPSSSD